MSLSIIIMDFSFDMLLCVSPLIFYHCRLVLRYIFMDLSFDMPLWSCPSIFCRYEFFLRYAVMELSLIHRYFIIVDLCLKWYSSQKPWNIIRSKSYLSKICPLPTKEKQLMQEKKSSSPVFIGWLGISLILCKLMPKIQE